MVERSPVSSEHEQDVVRVAWQPVQDDAQAADRLLAAQVAEVLRCPVAQVRIARSCPHCGGSDHGVPVVLSEHPGPPPQVSLSRAPGVVVVAVSSRHRVGVDIERLDATWPDGTAGAVLHPGEQASSATELTRLWVRKESVLKATGQGLRTDPSAVLLGELDPSEAAVQDLQIDGYAACLAVVGASDVVVTQVVAAPAAPRR